MCETHKYSANYRVFLRQRLSEIEIGGVDILKKKMAELLSLRYIDWLCMQEREREGEHIRTERRAKRTFTQRSCLHV